MSFLREGLPNVADHRFIGYEHPYSPASTSSVLLSPLGFGRDKCRSSDLVSAAQGQGYIFNQAQNACLQETTTDSPNATPPKLQKQRKPHIKLGHAW